ncbi:MAG: hypothetical protein M3174_02525 [Actinomycetota bacterium]|nr:hypothetical protein [Actinomycetota bacterium]
MALEELWLRYFELGGLASPFEVEAILQGVLAPDRLQHDILTHALNERFSELGRDRPLPYQFPD